LHALDINTHSDAAVARIGGAAPEFEARSTLGQIRLSDYAGSWVLLFSHPADFTPVCTSEFIAFEKKRADFDAAGCKLIGLSVDSLYSHLAWVKDIEARFGVRIGFPIVEDISMAIARAYGMVDSASRSTATVRAVFVIDPQQIIRATIYYPMNVGRSVDELFRVLQAIQIADEGGVVTPEGWRPGDDTLRPPPTDLASADHGADAGTAAWYMSSARGAQ
jgi:peroxiredoxin (alkyl hydroperoxide reductase subunit C)